MKFIGIDVHSRQCTFVVKGKSGRILNRTTIDTEEHDLLEFVRSIKGKKKIAFEEGPLAQWLYVLLYREAEEVIVCEPTARKGAKTDMLDAAELAELLRVNGLKAIYHADNEMIRLRILISGYADVIEEIVRTKNRYKALFRQIALPAQGRSFYNDSELIALLDTEERQFVATKFHEQIKRLEHDRVEYLERFEQNAKKLKPVKLLTSIPGIAAVRANKLVGIIVTPYRFSNKSKFNAYAMLTKHDRMSDGKKYGRVKAHGRSELKEVFKSAFNSATQSNTSFRRKYEQMIQNGAGEKSARNAVTKQIAATVLGVWKSGKKYNDKKWEVTQRKQASNHSGT
jgi:transposase